MGVHVFPILTPSHLPAHPIPLGHPSAAALSPLSHASNLDWRSVSHVSVGSPACVPWGLRGLVSQAAHSNWDCVRLHLTETRLSK